MKYTLAAIMLSIAVVSLTGCDKFKKDSDTTAPADSTSASAPASSDSTMAPADSSTAPADSSK